MEKIITELNTDILTAYGFSFDGAYWVNNRVPFRLSKSSKGYAVQLENLPKGAKMPPPVVTNSDLVNLMMAFANLYANKQLEGKKFISNKAKITALTEALSEFASFDPKLRFRLIAGPQGMGLLPDNEYTHTLLSGLECEFVVRYKINEVSYSSTINFNPECICYEFLKELFKTDDIISVHYVNKDKKEIPFFGTGLKKVEN